MYTRLVYKIFSQGTYSDMQEFLHFNNFKNVWFYIAEYPVRWTAQSALYFSSPGKPVNSDTNSVYLGSILAMTRNDYSLTFPPLSIAGTHL